VIFSLLTLFPNFFASPLRESLIAKASDRGLLTFHTVDIRDFADDVHRTCDDAPYGGGGGMVMKVEPLYRAMTHVEKELGRPRFVLLSPQGRLFDGDTARRFARLSHICLICGRYEGVDERVLDLVDEELSIGNFILSGGEAAALVVIEAVSRFIPGVVGNEQSVANETFTEGLLDYPQYTRPEVFMDMAVPPVLLSGNHEEVRKWRRKEAIRKTVFRRPDIMERFEPSGEDRRLLKEILEDIPG
jgi:tRNA (guanine37-N1)-methyltransferase